MAIQIDDIRYYHSGGSGNTLATASLGGAKSTTRVTSQTATAVSGLITGVTIVAANNNAEGTGTMTFSPSTMTLTWQPPSSIYVYSVVTATTGTYTVGGSDGQLFVSVTSGSLPVIFKQDTYAVAWITSNVFPAVSAGMSLLGSIQYRCLYVYNNHASLTATALKLYISQQTLGPDSIFLGLDPAGVGNGSSTGVAAVIALDTTAPAGVVFTEPLTAEGGLAIASLAPGETFAFWEKRVVPAGSLGYIDVNTSKIGIALTS